MSKVKRWSSVQYALRGLAYVYKHERNFRVECFCTLLVLFSLFFLQFSRIEIIVLLLLCAMVLILEIVNTVAEHFLDVLKPRLSYQVQVVKDILAGMVLVSVILSFVIGCIIYIPAAIEFYHRFVI